MKKFSFIFIFTLIFSHYGYQSILLPNSTYELISGQSNYIISNEILFKNELSKSVSSTLFLLPEDIQVASFFYKNNFFGVHNQYKIKIIDYGNFNDSESQYIFSAKDIFFHYNLIKAFNPKFYFSFGANYLYSNIDKYNSSAIFFNASILYKIEKVLFQYNINNLGFILDKYTTFDESLPLNYSFSILYLPKYLKSSVGVNYQKYDDLDITNFIGEIHLYDSFSILIGYSSIAQRLYSNDNFEKDFITGLSTGLNFNYKNIAINFGLKNLGSAGLIQSISLMKKLN